jgi:hypothetical protein
MANTVNSAPGMQESITNKDAIAFFREFFTALGDGMALGDTLNAEAAIRFGTTCTLKPNSYE